MSQVVLISAVNPYQPALLGFLEIPELLVFMRGTIPLFHGKHGGIYYAESIGPPQWKQTCKSYALVLAGLTWSRGGGTFLGIS